MGTVQLGLRIDIAQRDLGREDWKPGTVAQNFLAHFEDRTPSLLLEQEHGIECTGRSFFCTFVPRFDNKILGNLRRPHVVHDWNNRNDGKVSYKQRSPGHVRLYCRRAIDNQQLVTFSQRT